MGSSHLYPEIDPYAHGHLEVGDGNRIYWECCGTPSGKPAVVLHGGPGSGCSPWHRRLFDPSAYRVVLFDQRNCGRSTPNASLHGTDLANNTTTHLVHDIEQLRCHLNIQHWLLLGGSWGSTLALAYAETHPDCVTEIILFGVTTGQRNEFDWLFRGGLAHLFPQEWDRLLSWLPREDRDGDVLGTDQAGQNTSDPSNATLPMGNVLDGILIDKVAGVTIGGNLISGNLGRGIEVRGQTDVNTSGLTNAPVGASP